MSIEVKIHFHEMLYTWKFGFGSLIYLSKTVCFISEVSVKILVIRLFATKNILFENLFIKQEYF